MERTIDQVLAMQGEQVADSAPPEAQGPAPAAQGTPRPQWRVPLPDDFLRVPGGWPPHPSDAARGGYGGGAQLQQDEVLAQVRSCLPDCALAAPALTRAPPPPPVPDAAK